ncbi:TrmO family methyltransferase domain-containing protein [Lacrimispora amygdalina]|uniref:TrmO family methyltransferase domain-containing protein n=1 Tax=Lacrimispora amygdalina TaxID=253257 RepID=UPI000BE2AB1E|nr:TrmO family methyltransferase [Lacrimispora amygdalina]
MFQIGEFSKLTQITIRMLRYYDEAGLLKPAEIDPWTGYRMYSVEQSRSTLQTEKPYKGAPEVIGVFATRSPLRPNPIALTTVDVIHIDYEKGVIQIAFIDAYDNTPVLDIKPYTPSFDRVETPVVPAWCSNWPKSIEESASFPWDEVFTF